MKTIEKIRDAKNSIIAEVEAYELPPLYKKWREFNFVLHKADFEPFPLNLEWVIAEKVTGKYIGRGTTPKIAVKNAKYNLRRHTLEEAKVKVSLIP